MPDRGRVEGFFFSSNSVTQSLCSSRKGKVHLFKKMKSNFFEKTLASGEPVFPFWCEKNQKPAPTGRGYVRRERRKKCTNHYL